MSPKLVSDIAELEIEAERLVECLRTIANGEFDTLDEAMTFANSAALLNVELSHAHRYLPWAQCEQPRCLDCGELKPASSRDSEAKR